MTRLDRTSDIQRGARVREMWGDVALKRADDAESSARLPVQRAGFYEVIEVSVKRPRPPRVGSKITVGPIYSVHGAFLPGGQRNGLKG